VDARPRGRATVEPGACPAGRAGPISGATADDVRPAAGRRPAAGGGAGCRLAVVVARTPPANDRRRSPCRTPRSKPSADRPQTTVDICCAGRRTAARDLTGGKPGFVVTRFIGLLRGTAA